MNIPYYFINENYIEDLNPFEGEINSVAETISTVLKSLFGQQDGFFATVQEAASRNIVLMLKLLLGDNLTMREFAKVLRSKENLLKEMKNLTDAYLMAERGHHPSWTTDEKEIAENVLESLKGQTRCRFRPPTAMDDKQVDTL